MSSTTRTLPAMGKTHPLTGQPLYAIGFRADGRPIFPIMGGAPDPEPLQRPDDVPQETWDALGDPGKAALGRERTARQQAEKDRDNAVRERDAARARPEPPKNDPPKPEPAKPGDGPDVATIVQQAVAAAIKPFQDAEAQRQTQAAAERIQQAVVDAAKTRLHDATDALTVDLTTVVGENGQPDPDKIKAALDDLIQRKPHLAKSGDRLAPPGIGGGAPATATEAEKVKAALAQMQRATGIRPAANSGTP